jgi:hypothetical protein
LIEERCVLVGLEEPICMVESCSDISDIDKCDGYSSALGKCFLNKDLNQNLAQKSCTNIEDIEYCDQLLALTLCNNATTSVYPNLQGDGINKYLCKWDPAVQMCQNRVVENEKDVPVQNKSNPVIIIVIIIVVVVVVLLIIIVIMILLKWRAKGKTGFNYFFITR